MLSSVGVLKYTEDKLIVEVDPDIGSYYRWLFPKYFRLKKPLFSPHISVIRNEKLKFSQLWGSYEGIAVEFIYDNYLYCGEVYVWLEVQSEFLKKIRLELGLTATSAITRSPDLKHDFHITIGNFK